MKMPVGNLPAVVASYFDSVIIPAAQARGSLWAFGSGFLGGLVSRNVNQMIQQYLPMAKSLGVIDSDNKIDVDLLYSEATKAMEKGRPTIMGYTLDQSDLERIRDIMNQYGG